ncbi:CZB domain-containing protein [Beggiatoa leptomitoformis]|uniref:Chemoreceptor zinc-binding domain-containing protein n=1 Tax=Beggiatoa leptomitoformis TaxID=288004 RepID=A0A2N9YDE2_9GAMM|nr:CZB domain-containing protein [Beggiatoa leptomitoformis]ALG69110.1 hypothetical protein AL038_17240 [Beggiatoa leptomitoformis]AUI68476.1 hypothetical protein BLE401_06985 [Beggiatoa leptomitoformis]
MASKAFFLMRLNDHVQYLKKIDATLNDKGEFQGTDCHDCKLGKWLYGEGQTEVDNLKNTIANNIFTSLFEPHERFHQISKQALELKKAGDMEAVHKIVTEMHILSNVISRKLLDLDELDR